MTHEEALKILAEPNWVWPNGHPTIRELEQYVRDLRRTPLGPRETFEIRASIVTWYERYIEARRMVLHGRPK